MKADEASKLLIDGRRVTVLTFKSSQDKLIEGDKGKSDSVLRIMECEWSDGRSPSVNMWLPRSITSLEQAAIVLPCKFKSGQKIVVRWDECGRDKYALNQQRLSVTEAVSLDG